MIFWTYNVFCNLNVGEVSLVYIYINFVNIRVCLISSLHTNRQYHKRLPCSPRQHTELFSFSWIIHVLFWLGPFHLFEEHYTYSNSVYAFIYKQQHVLTKWISFFITLDTESFALFVLISMMISTHTNINKCDIWRRGFLTMPWVQFIG